MSADPVLDTVRELLGPLLVERDLSLYDVERNGAVLRITVDRVGGIDLDTLAAVNRDLGDVLDTEDPIAVPYTLEVSSPGLERKLRTELHWSGAVGDRVRVKLRREIDGRRRFEGIVIGVTEGVAAVDSDGVTVGVDLGTVDKATTVFVWSPQPKPSGPDTRTRATPPAVGEGDEA